MNSTKDFKERREQALESLKKANYDPFSIFLTLQALHLDTKEDALQVVVYLKEKEKEIKEQEKKSGFSILKKRTALR